MVKISNGRRPVLAAAVLGIVGSSAAFGASATWSAAPTDSNWATGTNWSTGAAPGVINPTAGTLSADVATFNTPIFGTIGDASNPILNDNLRQVRSVLFDTGAGAYTIGTAGGNQLWLGHSGNVTMNAGVTNAQTFNAPVNVRLPSSTNGAYSLINNATAANATLTFAQIVSGAATSRPLTLTLDGSNTGTNTIASLVETGAVAIIKNGAGTWVLSGANTLTQKTTQVAAGATVNAGTLVLQNAASLGTLTAANIRATGTGTIKIDGGISLNNTGITLDGTGTILTNGSTTLASLPVAATATDVTLATTNAGDVFTAGGTAAPTGGAAATTIHTTGPGTVALNLASGYLGSYSIDAGRLSVGNATALGAAASSNVKFGTGSTGTLQLNNTSLTVAGLQGTSAASAVESGGGVNTLTVNNTAANQFGGVIRDGAGQISLTKSAAGVLALTGASTYTGNTTVNAGSLLANNASGSATGSSSVSVNANATVGGSGTISGPVTVNTSGRVAPGATAGAIGTLRVGSLSLASGTQLDYDVTSPASLDQTLVTDSGGLTINGGQFNFNGGTTAFTTNGVYNLIGYTGGIGGSGVSALALNAANKNLATNLYTFGTAGGYVTLTVANSGGVISYWNTDSSANWGGAGSWTPSQPNAAGAFASFGGGGTPITANRTVTLEVNKTVGTVAFNQPNGLSYTLTGNTLTLDNSGNQSFITDTAGSHTINSNVALTAPGTLVTVSGAADTLTVGGVVSGAGAVAKSGLGTLALTGNNTYTGGTKLNAGTVQINSATSLGDAASSATFAGGTVQLLADVASSRTYVTDAASGADVKIDTNAHTLTHGGTIAAGSGATGGLSKSGAGTLVLAGTNTYAGATSVTGGTLSVSANANLGDAAIGSGINLSNGGTLASTATFAANNGAGVADRAIVVGTGGGAVDVADTTTLTVTGAITGAGTLAKTNSGTLVLTNTGSTAAISVNAGTLTAGGGLANTNGGLGSGPITIQGGATVNSTYNANNSLGVANAFTVPTGQVGNLVTPNRFSWGGSLSGGGTLNVTVNTTVSRFDFNGNLAGFTGNLNLLGGGNARLFSNGGAFNPNSFQNLTLDLAGTVNIAPVTNSTGNTYTIGALSGSVNTAGLGGGTAGSPNYTVGGLNTNTTFGGYIAGNAILTKVGTGSLTLTNANGYTGLTNINGGTLAINGQFALGGAVYAGTTFNSGKLQYVASLPGTNGSADISQDSNAVAKPVTFAVNGATIDTNGNDVVYANSVGNNGAGGLTKTGTGKLTLTASSYNGVTTVNAGTLQLNAGAQAPVLTGTAGTEVQATGKLLLNYAGGSSPVAAIKGFLDTSYASNFATGQIRSTGLITGRTLGYGDNGLDTVTVRVTLPGDADLDGDVDFNDFLSLQTNFGAAGTRFDQGNFNYDGATDFNDFLALQTNFGQSVGFGPVVVTAEQVAAMTAFASNPLNQAVPEPASLALLGLGAAGLLRRRRT